MKIFFVSTIFVVLCVSVSVSASNSNSTNAGEDGDVHPNINLTLLELINDLPPGSHPLHIIGDFQDTEANILPGKPYTVMIGGEPQWCWFLWDPLCAKALVFDGNVDLGHHHMYWSVRENGLHYSWDKASWSQMYTWEPGYRCQ